jgi:hypothetical protein
MLSPLALLLNLIKFITPFFLFLFITVCHTTSTAQTGPGGVGNSSNNVLWLDANYLVFTDTGRTKALNTNNIQQWNDRSGNGKHAIQTNTANKPNYRTNSLNGLPTVRYIAANADRLTSTNVSTGNQASVWMVATFTTLPVSNVGLIQATPSGLSASAIPNDKSIGIWVRSNTAQIWGRGIQFNNTTSDIPLGTVLSSNTRYIVNNIYRTNRIDQYINSWPSSNNVSHNGTLKSWTDISIGRQSNESWNGNIAEVIFYNIEVNSAQKIIIDNYLSAKYGFNLGANDLYRQDNVGNGNFDFEVAGIGRIDTNNIHEDAQGTSIVRILNPSGLTNNEFLFWGHNNALAEAQEFVDIPSGLEGRFNRVWRFNEVSTSGTAVSVGSINIQWDLNHLGNVNDTDLRLLIDENNDGLFSDETPIAGAINLGSGIFEFTTVSAGTGGTRNNKRFTIATNNLSKTPLPVEFLNFTAKTIKNKQIQIEWQTESEINNKQFNIEKSEDGYLWETLSIVQGNINSNKLFNYCYVDNKPSSETVYYRLKQIDFDNNYNYSKIVSVDFDMEKSDFQIYPNPTNGILEIMGQNSELNSIKIYNIIGKDITNQIQIIEINSNRLSIDFTNLLTGQYHIKSNSFSKIVIKK